MGNYLTVQCEECDKEIYAEFKEDLLQPILIIVKDCYECGYQVGYEEGRENGWDAGFEAGKEDKE